MNLMCEKIILKSQGTDSEEGTVVSANCMLDASLWKIRFQFGNIPHTL